jgi:guanyl-specific ribonuclease Sa
MKNCFIRYKRTAALLLVLILSFSLISCGGSGQTSQSGSQSQTQTETQTKAETKETEAPKIDENGVYDSKEDVALYIHEYGHLPSNFITKKEARDLGWQNGGLEPYAPGKSLGGSVYKNYEGLLPAAEGREYYECDIDSTGIKKRNAKRIIYSNDGLIFYTEDHYKSFEQLY